MPKDNSQRRHSIACRQKPYPSSPPSYNETESSQPRKYSEIFEKNGWQDVTCSICMEYPHKAVLLLCLSHANGCRPYMCGTSFRYSNCLDQYSKACTKVTTTELSCPLCRGQVKGWTVVEPAREHLNTKTRCCVQDNCSFAGTYGELRKHTKVDHPHAKPREADPTFVDAMRSLASTSAGVTIFGESYVDVDGHLMYAIQFLEAMDSDGEDGSNTNNCGTSLYQRLRRLGMGRPLWRRRRWSGE